MNVCTCFLLFGTFAYINSNHVTTSTEDERRANLALKTSQEFNVKKKETDESFIGHKNILPPYSTVETFTDFIQEIVTILNTYNDGILEDFINILDKKIKKYHYKGCKFYESKGKRELRCFLAENLDFLTRKSVSEKRTIINKSMNIMKRLNMYDRNTQELLDYINDLYKDYAKEKFRQILTDLKGFSGGYGKTRTRDDFVRVIKECIRTAVFIDTDFKTNYRQELRKLIAKIKEFSSSTISTTNFIDFKPTVLKSNIKIYTVEITENVSNEDKTTTPSSKTNPTRTTAHIKEDNKRIRISSEARQEDATIIRENSERDESNRQQKTILMFYMTTEKPGISYKSEIKSKLVERMLEEESTGRLATGQSTTTQGLRTSSKTDLNNRMSDEGSSSEITEMSSKMDLKMSDEGSSTEITEALISTEE